MGSRSKYWCVTLNNYNEEQYEGLCALSVGEEDALSYFVVGREVGAGGTPHLQCYYEFRQRRRLRGVKTILLGISSLHCEVRRGSAEEAAAYCKKEGQFQESGIISSENNSPGKRTDIEKLKESITDGINFDNWNKMLFP